jgi:hypothetical protein
LFAEVSQRLAALYLIALPDGLERRQGSEKLARAVHDTPFIRGGELSDAQRRRGDLRSVFVSILCGTPGFKNGRGQDAEGDEEKQAGKKAHRYIPRLVFL